MEVVYNAALDLGASVGSPQTELIVKPRRLQVKIQGKDPLTESVQKPSGVRDNEAAASAALVRVKGDRLHDISSSASHSKDLPALAKPLRTLSDWRSAIAPHGARASMREVVLHPFSRGRLTPQQSLSGNRQQSSDLVKNCGIGPDVFQVHQMSEQRYGSFKLPSGD
jgi:hypothetical protein